MYPVGIPEMTLVDGNLVRRSGANHVFHESLEGPKGPVE